MLTEEIKQTRLAACQAYYARRGYPPSPQRAQDTKEERSLGAWLQAATSCKTGGYVPAIEWYAQFHHPHGYRLMANGRATRSDTLRENIAALDAFMLRAQRKPSPTASDPLERAAHATLKLILYSPHVASDLKDRFEHYLRPTFPLSFRETEAFFEENKRLPDKKAKGALEHRLGVWLNNITHRPGPYQAQMQEWCAVCRRVAKEGPEPIFYPI